MVPSMANRPAFLPVASVVVLTALAYALVGWLAVHLAVAPRHASPVYPSAGIALAVALVYGRSGLVGVVVGALCVNLWLFASRGPLEAPAVWVSAMIGVGAALQAALGRWLVQRQVSQPLTLADPADLARFYLLGGLVACLTNATVSTASLWAGGMLPADLALETWGTWWLGDSLGVLIGAPIVLAFIGRPRRDWARRRLTVALPMLMLAGLLGLAAAWLVYTQEQRARVAFERDAWGLADRVDAQLRRPQDALLGLHGVFDASDDVTPDEMRRAVAPWLEEQPFVVAMGYSARVTRDALPAFEARVRAEGPVADYHVFERRDTPDQPLSNYQVVAIRYIEPLAPNRSALGVNALSIPAARRAIERAAATGEMAATAGFRLTQSTSPEETGLVMYRALYDHPVSTDEARREAFRGVVFVTLRMDSMLGQLLRNAPNYLRWCLVDLDPGAAQPRLGGPPGCEAATPTPLHYARATTLGPRAIELRVDAVSQQIPGLGEGGDWLFSVIGLLATALLGALLLTVSGRQQRIEAAVQARTADLQRASHALRDSQERLRNIVDHVPIGVVYADADGRVREANPGLLSILSLPSVPRPAPTLLDWAHPEDRPALASLVTRLAHGGQPTRIRSRLQAADGREVQAQLTLSVLRSADDQPLRLVGVVEDVGEHQRLEASERAREQAEAASRAKSEFVGRMSHELRTPLNAMLGFAQLLGRDRSPALAGHQQRWTTQIQDAGWHLLNMINDTLDLSMVESGSLRLRPAALDPAVLVQATASLVASAADRHRVVLLTPQIDADAGAVWADDTRLRQILTNLLSNAVKYNRPDGEVAVRVGRGAEGRVRFEVADTGLGLSPEQAEHLFQPFNRLGREGSAIEGTGIGLVLSRRLAEAMGGSLRWRANHPQGSVFELDLPSAALVAPQAVTVTGPGDLVAYQHRLVHYVEDNETNVVLMQGMMAQRPQIELTVSRLGLDALGAIRSRRPDLILLDMHLPDIDGLELLKHLKQNTETASIPVLVLSADATPERIDRAMNEGALGYLAKPIDLAALLEAVDEILEQAVSRWG